MAEEETQQRTVTIDGTEYKIDEMSENARQQLINLRVADQEIERLNRQLAITRTARQAYARALQGELGESQ
ncbi:hypothetical protein HH1059_13740 [Halorhodospira halochloris]|uniref:Uncharacterized protein n=1 Tax=Halorhodospira halochloris TaxID=1052 RepID=A0A0X8X9Y1_HALHR|nr:DUF6447 family protein [Halorhodospira halochloris]MCG5548681.1 DUF6447 family protein [Halorhodospira halochloris]BAU58084.1 hypothetical protein HH1059_13740 [Halorhodospira halochloris]